MSYTNRDSLPKPVTDWIQINAGCNSFANSLLGSMERYGQLSDRQIAAVERNLESAPSAASTKPLARIVDTMLHAKQKLKYPKLRIDRDSRYMVLSVAGDRSKYTNSVMITDGGPFGDNEYYGRITPSGEFHSGRNCDEAILKILTELNEDPAAVISDSGHANGQCACCGRELTNPESVELGIGPVCATRWGVA
tara:strand:+ start:8218 stop:8799 length:582 start_codon:yes stop_codon:yes gene_type:complete